MPTATEKKNGSARAEDARASRPLVELRIVDPVEIMLDKPRTLVMDFEAMARFEDETGLLASMPSAWSKSRNVPALIWAACLHEDPGLTLDEVKSWRLFNVANANYLWGKLNELWGATVPDPDPAAPAGESEGTDDPNPISPVADAG